MDGVLLVVVCFRLVVFFIFVMGHAEEGRVGAVSQAVALGMASFG